MNGLGEILSLKRETTGEREEKSLAKRHCAQRTRQEKQWNELRVQETGRPSTKQTSCCGGRSHTTVTYAGQIQRRII